MLTPILQQLQEFSGVLIVSIIAFAVVFILLAGLFAVIYVNHYVKSKLKKNVEAAISASLANIADAPAGKAEFDDDLKKVVAAISAAIIVASGGNANIISVTPVQNSSNMGQMWRATGIAECMESRLGSRSW